MQEPFVQRPGREEDVEPQPAVTIIVTPWQHFGNTRAALESVFAFTEQPFTLVYVDGGSPPRVQRYLEEQAHKHRFTLLRSDCYLTSNQARNRAVALVQTPYVVFLDNGTLVTPGWLEALLDCERDTGAWAVGPLYCTGDLRKLLVFSAGPDLRIVEEQGCRRLFETAPCAGKPAADVRGQLKRRMCGYVKGHCFLTTRAVLARLGPFDEGYTNYQDHRDFSLTVAQAGGAVYFEPRAVAVIVSPPPFALSDLGLFLLRWSDAWLQPSVRHFAQKWGLDIDDPMLQSGVRFRDRERRRLFHTLQAIAFRGFGWRAGQLTDRLIDASFRHLLEPTIIARLERQRLAT